MKAFESSGRCSLLHGKSSIRRLDFKTLLNPELNKNGVSQTTTSCLHLDKKQVVISPRSKGKGNWNIPSTFNGFVFLSQLANKLLLCC